MYERPPTKGVDTGPSCKELGFFNKYNCFTFDLHVSRLILESEEEKYDKTDPRLFLAQNKLLFIKVSQVNFDVAWHFCENPGVICVAMENL